MPFEIEAVDQAKLDTLKRVFGGNVAFAELVAVRWGGETGTICYAMAGYDEMPEYKGLLQNEEFLALTSKPIEARFADRVFQKVTLGSTVDDSMARFEFIDDDGEIARLCELHGEGVRVQILFYFPAVDWLRERWWGHLETPDPVGGIMTPVPASFGFRSAQSSCPSRTRGAGCPFLYGGELETAEQIAENPCKYDRQVGGTHGQLDAGGNPYRTCGHTLPDCIARIGDRLEYGGGDTAADTLVVNETRGPNINATARGNETNLKSARRVVFGEVKVNEMDCLASLVEPDTKHPDKGSARVLIDGFEGPVEAMWECQINSLFVGFQHLQVRFGTYRQPPTGFSPNVNNYSMSAHFYGVIQGDFRGYLPGQFKGSARVGGLRDVREYSDPNTFALARSTSPDWCILRMLTDKVWGDGQDISRFVLQDWIDGHDWHAELAGFSDASGTHYASQRASFNAILEERTVQQQISDACLFAGLSLPFPFQGKSRIVPLRKEDLTDVPVFSDDPGLLAGDSSVRPIRIKSDETTLRTRKVFSEAKGELVNYLVLTFLDAAHGNVQRPITVQDDGAQRREGRAAGDYSRKIVKAEYSALGVTDFGQAVRAANRLLDLGEFDRGGLMNNREATFECDFLDTLDLHKYKVIRIVSPTLERYKLPNNAAKHFQYFRVQEMADVDDLFVSLRGVAYNEDYYEQMEDETVPPPRPGSSLSPNPAGRGRPNTVGFDLLTHNHDNVNFRLALS